MMLASMENEDRESFYPADGVFVALGTAGSTEIARQMGAELTDKGNVRVNSEMETTFRVCLLRGTVQADSCRYPRQSMREVWRESMPVNMFVREKRQQTEK